MSFAASSKGPSCWYLARTISTASWSVSTSQTPSHARMRNGQSPRALREASARCGSAMTKSFMPWSPKLRVTANIPRTL